MIDDVLDSREGRVPEGDYKTTNLVIIGDFGGTMSPRCEGRLDELRRDRPKLQAGSNDLCPIHGADLAGRDLRRRNHSSSALFAEMFSEPVQVESLETGLLQVLWHLGGRWARACYLLGRSLRWRAK